MQELSLCPLASATLLETAAVEAAEQISVVFLVTNGAITSPCVELFFHKEDLPPHPTKGMKLCLSFRSPFLASSLVARSSLPKRDHFPSLRLILNHVRDAAKSLFLSRGKTSVIKHVAGCDLSLPRVSVIKYQ